MQLFLGRYHVNLYTCEICFGNIREGGEIIQSNLKDPYLVYLAWRSFWKPPV